MATASRAVSAADGWLTAAPPGDLRVGRRAEERGDLRGRGDVGADVDPARVAVVAEQRGGDREADERGAVDLRRERQRVQDAGDGEPLAADQHPRAACRWVRPSGDAEGLRRLVAEDGHRVASWSPALRKAPWRRRAAEHGEQRRVRRPGGEAARVVDRNPVAAVDARR